MVGRPAAALFAVLIFAACGGGGGAIDHPTGAGELVLRVETGGGLVPPEVVFGQLPGFSLLGDGRIVVPGPQIEIYPGPALPNLLQRTATEEGVQTILHAADEAGLLGPDRRYEAPGIMDAPTTVFTTVANGARHVISAYALGFEVPSPPGVGHEELDARQKLTDFQAKLSNLESWLPADSITQEESYTFDELRVSVEPYSASAEPGLQEPETAWPLTDPLATFGRPDQRFSNARCGVVRGGDLVKLLPEARSSNELTPWTSGGERYHLVFRPLLPDEHGC